ncbi:MAG: trigger factor [Eubacterium sp.]|nr:trigger factor [Eubacterium sp.]
MSVQVERLEHNMAKLTIEVEAKEFDAAMKRAYNKQKSSFNLPGFRKGKVPMNMIEKTYGAGVFYEDAANDVMQTAYPAAVDECELDIVSRPEVDIVQIGKGQNLIFTATVAVKPEVTLGEYKGLAVDKVDTEVTEEEIQEELKKAQEKNSREVEITDRPVKEGDIIRLNYAGTIDGVPFDGGTAENQNLTIGSHSFIDTFEDQLVGLNIGDTKDVEVTFPEEYHAQDLAGKPATFHVEILGIKEKQLDELDDDFAADYTDFDTLDEYKEDIRLSLKAGKEENAKNTMQNALIEQAVENAQMDIPEAMIESEIDQMVEEFKQRVSYQGLSFEQYLQFTGGNLDALKDSMRPQAESRVKGSLVLEAIVAAEGITASDEDLQGEFDRMASMYQMEADQIASFMGDAEKENMKRNIAVQKAVDFLYENANITEASEELDFDEAE